MALKLDELLTKKKEPVQILDLSKSSANSKEEFKKLLEKVPEFKIKMEKLRPEDVKMRDKKFSFKTSKKDLKPKMFPFVNPVPSEMKCLRLDDLCSVGIPWRMLTSIRPKNRLDEEYYSKLIELGKLQTACRENEKKISLKTYMRKTKTRSDVQETRFLSCRQCGEEFCSAETCNVFAYDCYERLTVSAEAELAVQNAPADAEEKKYKRTQTPTKKKFKQKKRKSTKSQQMKLKKTNTSKLNMATHRDQTHTGPKSAVVVNKIRKLQKLTITNARNTITNKNRLTSTGTNNLPGIQTKLSGGTSKPKMKQRRVKHIQSSKKKK